MLLECLRFLPPYRIFSLLSSCSLGYTHELALFLFYLQLKITFQLIVLFYFCCFFFVDQTRTMSITVRAVQISSAALNDEGATTSGHCPPASLSKKIISLFTSPKMAPKYNGSSVELNDLGCNYSSKQMGL